IPLIRYNLHDRGEIWDWTQVRAQVRRVSVPPALQSLKDHVSRSAANMPDLIAHFGRKDALKLCGGLVYLSALDSAVHHPSLSQWATGRYAVALEKSAAVEALRWTIELRPGVSDTPETRDLFYRTLIEQLC